MKRHHTLICTYCNIEYRANRRDSKYCSNNCRSLKHYWDKNPAVETPRQMNNGGNVSAPSKPTIIPKPKSAPKRNENADLNALLAMRNDDYWTAFHREVTKVYQLIEEPCLLSEIDKEADEMFFERRGNIYEINFDTLPDVYKIVEERKLSVKQAFNKRN